MKKIIFLNFDPEQKRLITSEGASFDNEFFSLNESEKVKSAFGEPFIVVIDRPEESLKLVKELKTTAQNSFIIVRTDCSNQTNLIGIIEVGVDLILPEEANARTIFCAVKAKCDGLVGNFLTIENLVVDRSSRSAAVSGKNVHLTELETKLLVLFILNKGKVLKRDHILIEVWGDTDVTARTIDSHIVGLRKKLSGFTLNFDSIYGVGYILRGPEFS